MGTDKSKKRWSAFDCVESAELKNAVFYDASSRAYVKIPLMHVGPNAKGLYWTKDVLQKIAPMFENTTFKYDLEGREGSSHVPEKLYSPYFDVGWTSKSYYDEKTSSLWVEGWVTHPEPVGKIERVTPDGKRELNYASMGVLIDPEDVRCSVCGKNMSDCGHKRNEMYEGKIAYAVPVAVEKALHVALTNAPADTEAVIAEAVFQEMRNLRGEKMAEGPSGVGATDSYTNQQSRPNSMGVKQPQPQQGLPIAQFQKDNAGQAMMSANPTDNKFAKTNESVGAMADDAGMAPTDAGTPASGGDMELEEMLKTVIQRLIALEEKVGGMGGAAPSPVGSAGPTPAPSMAGAEMPKPMGMEAADMTINKKFHNKLLREVADKAVKIGRFKESKSAAAYFADKSIDQLEVLAETLEGVSAPASAPRVETASISEFGAPRIQRPKGITEMSASERKQKLGEFASWDACFRPEKYEVA